LRDARALHGDADRRQKPLGDGRIPSADVALPATRHAEPVKTAQPGTEIDDALLSPRN